MVQYKIDGSSELRTIDVPDNCTDKALCDLILKSLFGDSPPTCDLMVRERGDVVLLSRVYAKKFNAIPKFEVKPKRRRKRWVSRSPPRKRWVSRSPERNRRY
jgi:hypothetical protein